MRASKLLPLVLLLAIPTASSAAEKARVVLIFDRECQVWCNKVKPVVADLEKTYSGQVDFVSLDTSAAAIDESRKTARTLKISRFLASNEEYAPVIGVFTGRGKLVKELVGPKSREIYQDAIARAIETK